MMKPKPNPKVVENHLVKNLRKVLLSRSATAHLAPYTRDGVRLFNFLFDATKAAETVELRVKDFQLQPAEVTTSTKRGYNVVAVSEIILGIVSGELKSREQQVDAALDRLEAERSLPKNVSGKSKRIATNRK
jgi:hypothetical protein